MTNRMQDLALQLKAAEDKNAKLTRELDECRSYAERIQEWIASYQTKLDVVKTEMQKEERENSSKIQELTRLVEEYQSKIAVLERGQQALQQENANLLEQHKADVHKWSTELKQLQEVPCCRIG